VGEEMTEPIEAFCWVPVKLMLPTPKDDPETVMVWTDNGEWLKARFCIDRSWRVLGFYGPVNFVTHWARVPAPKERK
jgi:hypothetical protein